MAAMGIGRIGAPNIILKRENRFTISFSTPCGNVPEYAVKVASKPKSETEAIEIAFLNATTHIPGKTKWQPITIEYYDVANNDMSGLYNWAATVNDFTDPVGLKNSEKAGWNGTGMLTMYDGCGTPVEMWILGSCFPENVDYGALRYASGEPVTISVTIRYSEVTQIGLCGPTARACCTGC